MVAADSRSNEVVEKWQQLYGGKRDECKTNRASMAGDGDGGEDSSGGGSSDVVFVMEW